MTFHQVKRLTFAAAIVLGLVGGMRAASARTDDLVGDATRAIASYRSADPTLDEFFRRSAGYVVFRASARADTSSAARMEPACCSRRGLPSGR